MIERWISSFLLVGLILLNGCTRGGTKGKEIKLGAPGEFVKNQFVFSGARGPVEKYLKEQNIEASFELLDEEDQFYLVNYQGSSDLKTVMSDLSAVTQTIEPNKIIRPDYSMRKVDWPTDKLFFKQWALNNIGQAAPYGLPGARGADLDILKVWDKVTKGSEKVVVAVIDTGCDYTHPDLKKNIWVNQKEAEANGGIAGQDDDGNGYVDDVYGYDFVSNDKMEAKPGAPGDADPMDEQSGHGTHCAGSIGASANDGVGIAGLNQNVKIMCVRFLGEGGGTMVDAFRALRYARQNGANVMSNSYGGTGEEPELYKSELRKIEKAGIVFVAASGNNGTNNDIEPHYPSNLSGAEFRGKKFENVISVGASDNQDNPADFSNYGHESVDVFAPGVAIVSTYPQALTAPGRNPYAIMSGTSMAAPYVAGVAALMMAANPKLIGQAAEVVRILKETVDVKDQLIGKARSNGRVNAYRAVTAELNGPLESPVWQVKNQTVDMQKFNSELVDIRSEIKVEGAKSIKVHFDFIQIEEPYDSIYLYDKNYRLIARVEKNLVDDFWSPAIPGDTVYVRFVNSLLQQITVMPMKMSSENACMSRGGRNIVKTGSDYSCDVDSDGGADKGGAKKYVSFNSEGFHIDQVAYVAAQEKERVRP